MSAPPWRGLSRRQLLASSAVLSALATRANAQSLFVLGAGTALTQVRRNIASHVLMPGFNGTSLSNGTDTGANYRSFHINEGGNITNISLVYSGWTLNSTNEQDGVNPITVFASVEYPSGTFHIATFGSNPSVIVPATTDASSDRISVSIPAGASFWVRTYITVPSGNKWPRTYLVNTNHGEACDQGTSTVNLTAGGTIINNPTATGYGPSGILSTAASLPISLGGIGDSILAGAGDGNEDSAGNTDWAGRAATVAQLPWLNGAVTGTAAFNQTGHLSRRLALMATCGITHVVSTWSSNDAPTQTAAQIEANLTTIWNSVVALGMKMVHTTMLPRGGSTTDAWKTVANQTNVSPTYTGSGSVRGVFNAWIRTLPTPLYDFIEISNPLEVSLNDGIWVAGAGYPPHLTSNGTSTDAATGDGTHPDVTFTSSPFYGGQYILQDVAAPQFATWT